MARKKEISKVHPLVDKTVRNALKVVFIRLFNVKINLPEEVKDLQPPYVVLPNHQGFWDPFLAAAYLKYPVYYITSDAVFRSRLFNFLLKFLGAIPKTKSQSDLDALKHIFDMKEQGRNIGIFPEGQRTWAGSTLPLIKSTSKLIRMLKLPVVTVLLKGGYISHPRWGTSIRTGELSVNYRLLFKGDEVGKMKVSEIHDKLTDALAYDEIEYQKQQKTEYRGKRLAQNIEQLLFACSSCGAFGTLVSSGDSFSCSSCGNSWSVNSLQEISSNGGESGFDNVRDWDNWQLEKMRDLINSEDRDDLTVFEDEDIVIRTGFKSDIPKPLARGSIRLTTGKIILSDKDGNELVNIPVTGLTGVNVQDRSVLDFYHNNILYTNHDPKRRFNAYKYWRAVDYLQREKYKMNLPD